MTYPFKGDEWTQKHHLWLQSMFRDKFGSDCGLVKRMRLRDNMHDDQRRAAYFENDFPRQLASFAKNFTGITSLEFGGSRYLFEELPKLAACLPNLSKWSQDIAPRTESIAQLSLVTEHLKSLKTLRLDPTGHQLRESADMTASHAFFPLPHLERLEVISSSGLRNDFLRQILTRLFEVTAKDICSPGLSIFCQPLSQHDSRLPRCQSHCA